MLMAVLSDGLEYESTTVDVKLMKFDMCPLARDAGAVSSDQQTDSIVQNRPHRTPSSPWLPASVVNRAHSQYRIYRYDLRLECLANDYKGAAPKQHDLLAARQPLGQPMTSKRPITTPATCAHLQMPGL